MQIGLLRLAAQRVAGPGCANPAEVVSWLAAVQAQDLRGALTSVALRTAGRDRAAVEAALNAGVIVRSWPMRGTLHLVAAADLPWLRELLTPRVVAGAARRRANLGIDDAVIGRARELAVAELAGGGRLRRDELFAAWEKSGVEAAGQRGYHLLWHLAQTGTLCLGPLASSNEQFFVLSDEWIASPHRPDRGEALAELAGRFFRSHGPATVKDFIRWTGLTAADARAGLASARPGLATMEYEGTEHFLDPETPERLRAAGRTARGVFLLPGFDEFVLGYGDRSAVLPAAFADRIVPGGNGVFQPTVVSAGQIVGTWRYTGRGAARVVTPALFEPVGDRVAAAITRAAATLPA